MVATKRDSRAEKCRRKIRRSVILEHRSRRIMTMSLTAARHLSPGRFRESESRGRKGACCRTNRNWKRYGYSCGREWSCFCRESRQNRLPRKREKTCQVIRLGLTHFSRKRKTRALCDDDPTKLILLSPPVLLYSYTAASRFFFSPSTFPPFFPPFFISVPLFFLPFFFDRHNEWRLKSITPEKKSQFRGAGSQARPLPEASQASTL